MNFNISNLNFNARYTVYGKQSSAETVKVYEQGAAKFADKGTLAAQAQDYFETPFVQKCISELPEGTFVRLHTGVLDGQDKKEDKILGFTPFVSFEAKTINEQFEMHKRLNGGDSLKLSLDEQGDLNRNEINQWFNTIIDYYV